MAAWVFTKDVFIQADEASLPVSDLSIQRGYGVFDFFRLVNHQPLFLDDHLQRFYHSASTMHLTIPYTKEELKAILLQFILKNNLPDAGIRLTLTGGSSSDGMTIGKPNFIITQQSLGPISEAQKQGLRLMTYSHQRQLPEVKTIDYLMAIWLQPLIRQKGFDDVLYYSHDMITECPRSNFFLVMKDDTIVTPAEGVLYGITRQKVIQLAAGMFKVEERAVGLHEIHLAREAFITSTTKQILPVRQIDDKLFETEANEVTRQLQVRLANLINENIGL